MLFCNEKHETVFEHSNVLCQDMRFSIFSWLHWFIFCAFHVKYLISQLFLLLVFLPSCMYVVSLNEKYICRSHNNRFGTEYFIWNRERSWKESVHNVKFLGRNALHAPTKLIPVCCKFALCQVLYLNLKNLYKFIPEKWLLFWCFEM